MAGHLPPVLSHDDLRFTSFSIEGATLRIVFKRANHTGYGDIVVSVVIPRSEITYEYWVLDVEAKALVRYVGKHGDPSKDRPVDVKGV